MGRPISSTSRRGRSWPSSTLAGPPERMIARAPALRSCSAVTSNEKSWAWNPRSRTRRAMSRLYCAPKSRTAITEPGALLSMTEDALPIQRHGDSETVARGDHLLVLDRSARLQDRAHSHRGGALHAVGEGEERVGNHDRAFQRVAFPLRLEDRDLDRVDAAALTGADPERLSRPRE